MSDDKFTPKGEEDVKAEVIEQLDLDEETQSELIDNITDERLEHQKSLSTAIRQKRDKAKALEDMEKGKDFYKAQLKDPKRDKVNLFNQQNSLSRDEAILFAQGYTEEEVNLASKLSKLNGTELMKSLDDDYFKSQVEVRKNKEISNQAGLSASQGGVSRSETPDTGKMSTSKHQKYCEEELKKAGLN